MSVAMVGGDLAEVTGEVPGSFPLGLVSPNRTDVMAPPAVSPSSGATRTALDARVTWSRSSGRPETTTDTTGRSVLRRQTGDHLDDTLGLVRAPGARATAAVALS